MKYGHVTGTKQERTGSSDWYQAIEAANLQAVEDTERTLVTALAHQVGNAVAAMPEAATRITKAAALVQSKSVWPLQHNAYLVGSQSSSTDAHLVHRSPAWTCTCLDHQARKNICKHQFAAMFTVKLGTTYAPNYN